MSEANRSAQIVRFGVFEADLQTRELHKNGVKVPLQGQPFQVFAILLEHPSELVTREERSEIYLLEVGGGMPQLLPTLPGANNGGPSWSRDGKSIYFYSDKTGEPFQLWKVSIQGGSPAQITENGGVFSVESEDGRFLYFVKFDAPGIWKMPLGGGQEERVLPRAGGHEWFNWALTRAGIYFRDSDKSKNNDTVGVLKFFDFATGKTTTVTATDQPGGVGLAVSPDGRSILYDDKGDAESTIMLVKNFR